VRECLSEEVTGNKKEGRVINYASPDVT
jgi:hypothetical protein